MARTYKRDSNGRFSSTGGARSGRPAAKPVSRGKNRITRDNAGRIASVGGEGATARGGRLRTAAGNKRAVQTARIKGSGGRLRKPVGGGGVAQPATRTAAPPTRPSRQSVKSKSSKRTPKSIDSAKVERILGRVQSQKDTGRGFDRKGTVKRRNAQETRTRAMTYLAKAAGGKNVKTSTGRVTADYGATSDRSQLLARAAESLSKPTRRSTLKSGSKVVADRQARRKQVAADAAKSRRGEGASYMHGRRPGGSKQTLRVIPAEKPQQPTYSGSLRNYTPKPKPQSYEFDKITRSKRGSANTVGIAGDRKTFINSKTIKFSGSKVFRTKSQAAAAQAGRRRSIGALAGTARLGGRNSMLSKGRARQLTLTGDIVTTYGKLRRSTRKPS